MALYTPTFNARQPTPQILWYKRLAESTRERLPGANLIGLLGALLALACLLGVPRDQYWNIRIPLYLTVTIWTLIRPRVALYLLPLAIPWGSLDTIAGGLTSADILVALLATSWLMSYTVRSFATHGGLYLGALDYGDSAVPWYVALSMIIFLLMMIISMTVSFSLADSLKEIVKWAEMLVIVMLGTKYLQTRRQIWTIVVMMGLAGISQAILGYAQVFLHLGPASFVRDASLRVYGTFSQPNPYAGYINIILALALALLLFGHNWTTRILSAGVALPLAGVEYYSQSKGGWLAIAVAVLFMLATGLPRIRVLLSTAFIIAMCIVVAYFSGKIPSNLINPILTKIGVINISFANPSPDNYANSERVAHWVAGINMFLASPLLGVGMGNYQYAYPAYHQGIFVLPLGHAHNYYINIAAEAGLLGLTAFIFCLLAIFVVGSSTYRVVSTRYLQLKAQTSKPPTTATMIQASQATKHLGIQKNDRALALGLLAALLSVCIHNLVDNLYVHAMTSLFALLLVLLIRLREVSQPSQHPG